MTWLCYKDNKKVRELFLFIFTDANADTDYWYCGGYEVVVQMLSSFEKSDLEDLKRTLVHWDDDITEILAQAICDNDYDFHLGYCDPHFRKIRSDVYLYLLGITKDPRDIVDLDPMEAKYILIETLKSSESYTLARGQLLKIDFKTFKLPSLVIDYFLLTDQLPNYAQNSHQSGGWIFPNITPENHA